MRDLQAKHRSRHPLWYGEPTLDMVLAEEAKLARAAGQGQRQGLQQGLEQGPGWPPRASGAGQEPATDVPSPTRASATPQPQPHVLR
jgi:hypothetical protein